MEKKKEEMKERAVGSEPKKSERKTSKKQKAEMSVPKMPSYRELVWQYLDTIVKQYGAGFLLGKVKQRMEMSDIIHVLDPDEVLDTALGNLPKCNVWPMVEEYVDMRQVVCSINEEDFLDNMDTYEIEEYLRERTHNASSFIRSDDDVRYILSSICSRMTRRNMDDDKEEVKSVILDLIDRVFI